MLACWRGQRFLAKHLEASRPARLLEKLRASRSAVNVSGRTKPAISKVLDRKNVGTVPSFVSSDLKNSFWPNLGSICRPSHPGIAVRSLRMCGRGATPPGITLTYDKTRGLSPRFVNSWGRSSHFMSSGRHVPISSYRFGCGCIRSRV
jgi:hypothetical protein